MDAWILSTRQYQALLDGAQLTVQVLAYSFVLGVVLSLVFGVMRLSEKRAIRGAALIYVEFARGISSIILLTTVAIAVPIWFEIDQAPLIVLATIALGINMGGYGAEIVRGSINSVPKGQTEASIALNLSPRQRLRHVVLPQAMRLILPPFGNLTIEILKGTALVSLVGLTDLTSAMRKLDIPLQDVERTPSWSLNLTVLVIYFVVAQVINGGFRYAEHRVNQRFEQRSGPSSAAPEVAGAGG